MLLILIINVLIPENSHKIMAKSNGNINACV